MTRTVYLLGNQEHKYKAVSSVVKSLAVKKVSRVVRLKSPFNFTAWQGDHSIFMVQLTEQDNENTIQFLDLRKLMLSSLIVEL